MSIRKCPEVLEYIEYTKAYPNEVNKDRHLLINNIVLPLFEREDIYFDSEMFNKCIVYCEKNFYKLFPYQKFIYAFVFIFLKADNSPLFQTFVILMGRGNGKDGCIMPLLNFLQTPVYGIKNYHIDIIANSEEQSKGSFSVVYEMLEANSNKFKGAFYWTKEVVKNMKTRSVLRFNTSNAKTKDGKQAGANFYNEYHAYEDYAQIGVFDSQLGKIPHARKFIATTNGYVRDGPLDDLLEKCRDIVKTGVNNVGYFPFLCSLDNKSEIDDLTFYVKANPSLPFLPNLKKQIEKDFIEMKEIPSKRPEFVTKRANLPERNEDITVASWNDILKTTYDDITLKTPKTTPDLQYRNCVIGIDYADIRDFASAGILFKIDGEYIWRQKTWICANSPFFKSIKFGDNFKRFGQDEFNDFEIVYSETLSVDDVVKWCFEQTLEYSVQKIVMDTFRYTLFRETFDRYGITPENKSNPYGMLRMIRNIKSVNTLVAPIIESAFANNRINFGSSAIMRWYTNNTSVSIDKFGNKSYGKIEPKLRKNDGFMAFAAAMSAEKLLDEIVMYV